MKMVIKGMFYGMGNRNKMYNFYPRYQMPGVKQQNEKHEIMLSFKKV